MFTSTWKRVLRKQLSHQTISCVSADANTNRLTVTYWYFVLVSTLYSYLKFIGPCIILIVE